LYFADDGHNRKQAGQQSKSGIVGKHQAPEFHRDQTHSEPTNGMKDDPDGQEQLMIGQEGENKRNKETPTEIFQNYSSTKLPNQNRQSRIVPDWIDPPGGKSKRHYESSEKQELVKRCTIDRHQAEELAVVFHSGFMAS